MADFIEVPIAYLEQLIRKVERLETRNAELENKQNPNEYLKRKVNHSPFSIQLDKAASYWTDN